MLPSGDDLSLHNDKMSLSNMHEMFRPSEQLVEEALLLSANQVPVG